ncbi:hypothetical protein AWM79_23980 [Pseudomonas agarici]|uniref:Pentapeptide repeat-containing protein n=1 Tax=Pseudomonas agarici TaxID=46677 RepID=A0A0X1T7T4_PSEAA|nr:pentapeptide repeat-containing protein [Pseudomonas agarici]AMB88168.1 hypothetical protein AWM79_23980 [Pseudomonas agarici]
MALKLQPAMHGLLLALTSFAAAALSASPAPAPCGGSPLTCPFSTLTGVDWSGRDLTNANLLGADLTNANLSGANLSGAELAGANLTNVNLSNAILKPSGKGYADLSRANLQGANLTGAKMDGTDLEYTDLGGTDFSATDLSRVRFGPTLHTGLYAGRKTLLRNSLLPANLALDPATSDITDARFAAVVTPTVTKAAWEADCGSSDLSQLTSAVYVTPAGTDSDSCGASLEAACATIEQALGNCQASGCGVLVGYGEYQQTTSLTVRDGVSLYGGCVRTGQASDGLRSLIKAPPNGVSAITAINIKSATQIENFKIFASPGASTGGAASVALQVKYSEQLAIVNSEIYAAPGATGDKGCDGCNIGNNDQPMCGGMGLPSVDMIGSFTSTLWSGSRGGGGRAGYNGYRGVSGGGGGGQQGGGSFAVILANTAVHMSSSRIVGAIGGTGGNGGNGATNPLHNTGSGAGGNGGLTVGVVSIGNVQFSADPDVVFYFGGHGPGGIAGIFQGESYDAHCVGVAEGSLGWTYDQKGF